MQFMKVNIYWNFNCKTINCKKLIDIANQTGADAVSHGATGKGNDQVRFELGALALRPDIKVIAPWREWDLNSRESLLEYARKNGIEIAQKHVDENGNPKASPYSMDANLLHFLWRITFRKSS